MIPNIKLFSPVPESLNNALANLLCQAGVEHGRTYDEHACEQYYRGVGQTTEDLFRRDKAQDATCDGASGCGYCQGNDFRNKEERQQPAKGLNIVHPFPY
jgi:hypothetical protein